MTKRVLSNSHPISPEHVLRRHDFHQARCERILVLDVYVVEVKIEKRAAAVVGRHFALLGFSSHKNSCESPMDRHACIILWVPGISIRPSSRAANALT